MHNKEILLQQVSLASTCCWIFKSLSSPVNLIVIISFSSHNFSNSAPLIALKEDKKAVVIWVDLTVWLSPAICHRQDVTV